MNDEVRVGVFVCDCGSNIAGVVNVPEVVEYSRGLDRVAYVEEGKWSCAVDSNFGRGVTFERCGWNHTISGF